MKLWIRSEIEHSATGEDQPGQAETGAATRDGHPDPQTAGH